MPGTIVNSVLPYGAGSLAHSPVLFFGAQLCVIQQPDWLKQQRYQTHQSIAKNWMVCMNQIRFGSTFLTSVKDVKTQLMHR